VTHDTREGWLIAAVEHLTDLFNEHGYKVPQTRVSCGFPGGRKPTTTIGQCWPMARAKDGITQMFVSPILDHPVSVMAVLVHELVHAVDDCKNEHKRPFAAIAKKVGLEGPWKATSASDGLVARLDVISGLLGEYPHSPIDPTTVKKQSTRMLKIVCPDDGYTVRTTAKWIDVGLPSCPCGAEMDVW
jgi:hypothetical protein